MVTPSRRLRRELKVIGKTSRRRGLLIIVNYEFDSNKGNADNEHSLKLAISFNFF